MNKTRFPYRVYTIPTIAFSALGLATSIYLSISHFRNYTDVTYSSFCAISKSINCDTVSQSTWSIMLGLPLALWGVLAYLIFLVLSIAAQYKSKERRYLWDLLFLFSLVLTAADIYLGYIAAVKIKAYCILCILTYAISMCLLLNTFIIRQRFNNHPLLTGLKASLNVLVSEKKYSFIIIIFIISFSLFRLFIPTYWDYQYPALSSNAHKGRTEQGNPWIGSKSPLITINEFTDYQCFQCSKMHLVLRQLVNRYPDQIRLVHYHYPMDEKFNTVLVKQPFHTGSGELALLAIAADKQGNFWKVNDSLYAVIKLGIEEFNKVTFAEKLQLDTKQLEKDMYSESSLKQLEHDIRTGLKSGVVGTPSYIIEDKVYIGHIPSHVLKRISDE